MSNHAILTAEAHRTLRIRTDRGAALGDAVMSSIVMPGEFRRVQEEYPILFRLDAARDTFAAVALFGFVEGENLFLSGAGWTSRARPLALEVQPFLIGGADAAPSKQVHVDLASPRIAPAGEGVALFDEDGKPTPYLERVADQLGELDAGYQDSHDFYDTLRRYELLEPTMIDVTLDDGSTNRLTGYHAIDEERLAQLGGAAVTELHNAGHLLPIYMALASLGKIGELVARKNARLRDG